jgi:hypothetical protein
MKSDPRPVTPSTPTGKPVPPVLDRGAHGLEALVEGIGVDVLEASAKHRGPALLAVGGDEDVLGAEHKGRQVLRVLVGGASEAR